MPNNPKRIGMACIIIGLLNIIHGVPLLVIGPHWLSQFNSSLESAPYILQHWDLFVYYFAWFLLLLGGLVGLGGLGICLGKSFGKYLVAIAIWLLLSYFLAFLVSLVLEVPKMGGQDIFGKVFFGAATLIGSLVLAAIISGLWLLQRKLLKTWLAEAASS